MARVSSLNGQIVAGVGEDAVEGEVEDAVGGVKAAVSLQVVSTQRVTELLTGRGERGNYPPYIHFTLQKTNRDTQDALAHLSRTLHCNVKDLSVAGTKDKRGVTVQRVSLRRGNKTVEDVWKMANGLNGRRALEEALTQRGERGLRVTDFNYRRASLELGMLKGNAFVITLR